MSRLIDEVNAILGTLVTCSRCKRQVRGQEFREEGQVITVGFYRLRGAYRKYARPGETVLCEECLTNDPRYIAEMGV